MSTINNLRKESLYLYIQYREGVISLKDYQEQLRPLESSIDKQELEMLKQYLQDNLAFEKPSLKHLH